MQRSLPAPAPDDPELRHDVEELLRLDETPEALINRPAWEQEPGLLASREIPAGTLLGPYRISRLLGACGMGSVYRCDNASLPHGRYGSVKLTSTCVDTSTGRPLSSVGWYLH